MKPTALLCSLLLLAASAQAQDLDALWDYARPALSEQRFRAALVQAHGDEALILQTQIARSLGLRRDFEGARALLLSLEPQLATAGPEARVRQALELGRSFISASHPPAQRTPEAREAARRAYLAALAEARAAGLDGLAVDALHMMAFVDSAPADQLRWNREALALAETSPQPAARRWRASLQNNLGLSLRELGRPQDALQAFQAALALREQEAPGNDGGSRLRIARWMVAHQQRLLGETEAALSQQLALEQACAAAGQPDPYVFEELEILYRARGDAARAAHYAQRRAGMAP